MLKLTCMINQVKRTTVEEGSKITLKGDTMSFKAKNGKKISVPAASVIIHDTKSIQYNLLMRKIVKGDFTLDDGFYFDKKGGLRVAEAAVIFAEEVVEKEKKEESKTTKKSKKVKKDKKAKKVKKSKK